MDILRYYCYIFVNCVIFPSLLSKPISLNDIIAAEKQAASLQSATLEISETKTNVREFPKNHKLTSKVLTKHTTAGIITPRNKKTSPLKYKKLFQIRTPLRPKKIKYSYKPRNRRINTTTKREINDEKINRNYIPLLKSLSVLFNNLLGSDSGEDDADQYYDEHQSTSRSEECPCAKYEYNIREPEPTKTATASTASIAPEILAKTKIISPETSSTSTYNTFIDNIRPLGRNKNISILPSRNTTGSWRNHNGFSEGSLSTYYRDPERHIARYNGSDESNNSRGREADSYTEHYKENSDSGSGHDASCNGACRTIGRNGNNTEVTENETTTTETDIIWSIETITSDRGDGNQFKGYNKLKTGRNETESRRFLSQPNSRLRGYTKKETQELSRQIQSSEESIFNITNNIASNQRISNGDGSVAEENQELSGTNKTLILDDIHLSTSMSNKPQTNSAHDKQKIVMIYDGYSIARDVNGDNKLTEKAYRIHS